MSDSALWNEFVALERERDSLRAENELLRAEINAMRRQEPYVWMTSESKWRLQNGGNCKGAVPVHKKKSNASNIPLYLCPGVQHCITADPASPPDPTL